jgi:putative hemolysin
MNDPALLIWVLVAALGLSLSAVLSGAETGMYLINRLRLRVRAESGHDRGARMLQREIERPNRILATLLIGNNTANYMGSLGISAIVASSGLSDWKVIVINAAVLTPVFFVFGETLPKEVFRSAADTLTPRLAVPLTGLRLLATFTGLLPLVQGFAWVVGRIVGAREGSMGETARDKVNALLQEGARFGVLSEAQSTLADRVFSLGDQSVRDVMIPWAQAQTVSVATARGAGANKSGKGRLHSFRPVVDSSGAVVGVLDTLRLWLHPNGAIRELMKPPVFVAPDAPITEAILALRAAGAELAIVQSGSRPMGLVTMKDLIEPVVGELHAY